MDLIENYGHRSRIASHGKMALSTKTISLDFSVTFSCLPVSEPPKDTFQTFESRYEATAFSRRTLPKPWTHSVTSTKSLVAKNLRSETDSRALDSESMDS